jgi:hypothetical protein
LALARKASQKLVKMGKSDKAAHRKLAGAGPGRPPAKPGKQVSRFKRQTVAATEASRVEGARGIAMSTVARIAVCLKFASGEIIDFSCRRLLLLPPAATPRR